MYLHRKELCVTLVIYQESLRDARSTKYEKTKDIIQKPNNPNPSWWINTPYLNSMAKEASLLTAHLPTGSSIHFSVCCTKMHDHLSHNIQFCYLTVTK